MIRSLDWQADVFHQWISANVQVTKHAWNVNWLIIDTDDEFDSIAVTFFSREVKIGLLRS